MSIKCIVRQSGGMMKEKDVVYPDVVDAATISDEEFLKMVCINRQLEPAQVKAVLSGVKDTLADLLRLGHRVKVGEIGSFSLDVKGRLEKDRNGVLQLKDASVKHVKMIPSKLFLQALGECKFSLRSHNVVGVADNDAAAAEEAVDQLLKEKPFFIIPDLMRETGISWSLANKMLLAMEQSGKLTKTRSGRYYIWSAANTNAGETAENTPPADEETNQPMGIKYANYNFCGQEGQN